MPWCPSPQRAVALLNTINALDPTVLPALITHRVPCNAHLAHHPTVQIGRTTDGYEVGLLGILNGLFGVDAAGYGPIVAEFNAGRRITAFTVRPGAPEPRRVRYDGAALFLLRVERQLPFPQPRRL